MLNICRQIDDRSDAPSWQARVAGSIPFGDIFILNFSLVSHSSQYCEAHTNEIKNDIRCIEIEIILKKDNGGLYGHSYARLSPKEA